MGSKIGRGVRIEALEPRTFFAATLIGQATSPEFVRVETARGGVLHWDVYGETGATNIEVNYDSTWVSDGTSAGTHTVDYLMGGLFGPNAFELHPGKGDFLFVRGQGIYTGNHASAASNTDQGRL